MRHLLAKEVVRHLSNLTAKECWEPAKRVLRAKHALGGIIDYRYNYLSFFEPWTASSKYIHYKLIF